MTGRRIMHEAFKDDGGWNVRLALTETQGIFERHGTPLFVKTNAEVRAAVRSC